MREFVETKPSYTQEQKREVLLDLLKHFDNIKTERNKALADSGERKYCSPLTNIRVIDIKNYALIGSGFEKF